MRWIFPLFALHAFLELLTAVKFSPREQANLRSMGLLFLEFIHYIWNVCHNAYWNYKRKHTCT